MTDHIGMLGDLLNYDGETGNKALSDWEVSFIDNIRGAVLEPATLTLRQKEKLEGIWNDVFGNNQDT